MDLFVWHLGTMGFGGGERIFAGIFEKDNEAEPGAVTANISV